MAQLPSRRTILKRGVAAAAAAAFPGILRGQRQPSSQQRIVIVMFDGFGIDYLEQSDMPVFAQWKRSGLYKPVRGLMPSVTNVNNASICCGVLPEVHGITGNSYFDEKRGVEDYMESAELLLAPTLFERAAKYRVSSALLSSKAKTVTFLLRGAEIVLTAEEPTSEWAKKLGPAPPIYSKEINYWLMQAAIDILRTRPDIGCVYIHTTDYPMHMWPPEARQSKEHLRRLDDLFGQAMKVAPDAAFLVTADHGMNAKTRCYDLEKICSARGVPVRKAFSAGRDRYVKHNRGCSGAAYVYLRNAGDTDRVRELVSKLTGCERVLTREAAAHEYGLMASRIGDLVVLGDQATLFGEMDTAQENFSGDLRSHGSEHERNIPLLIYNAKNLPPPDYFKQNLDLARWLYRA
ncbi:MAG TPA: alkaline phosphatase family protein [Candidatus Acidoferrales bacterium]|jgi:phosphonoacetate hydrolase|nr:alkaline phosphatase family protein [Candidatus Acidoferrales bacterium]